MSVGLRPGGRPLAIRSDRAGLGGSVGSRTLSRRDGATRPSRGSGNSGSCGQSCASTSATARSRICGTRPILERCWARWSAGREALVVGQALCRQSESLFADDGRNRYLDPLVTRPLVTAALFAMDRPPRQAEGPGHLLPLSDLCLVEAGRALIGRITEDRPYDRSLPASHPPARGQPHPPQQAGNRADAQTVHRIFVVHQSHDLRFGAITCRRIAGLANIAVAIGRAA